MSTKRVTSGLLTAAGGILVLIFMGIMMNGIVYPIPSLLFFAAANIIIFSMMVWAWYGIWMAVMVGSRRQALDSVLLLAGCGGLFVAYGILPVIHLNAGSPIGLYTGAEPNEFIIAVEMLMSIFLAAWGISGLIGDWSVATGREKNVC